MKALLIKLGLWIKKFLIIARLHGEHYKHRTNKNFKKFIANELNHMINGDERDDFEKLVEKCRILRLNRDIFNAGSAGC